MAKLNVLVLVPMTLAMATAGAVLTAGCSDVKQQAPPRIPDEGEGSDDGLGSGSGSDMAPAESDTLAPAEDSGPEMTEEEQRIACCQQCVDGLADDKSGDPPGAIPCTKLTTKMEARCVVHFDKVPTTGKEAQECAAAGEPEGPEDGVEDAAKE